MLFIYKEGCPSNKFVYNIKKGLNIYIVKKKKKLEGEKDLENLHAYCSNKMVIFCCCEMECVI